LGQVEEKSYLSRAGLRFLNSVQSVTSRCQDTTRGVSRHTDLSIEVASSRIELINLVLWETKSTNNSDLNYIAYRKVNSVHINSPDLT